MNWLSSLAILILAACLSLSFASGASPDIPDIVGDWNGTSTGHNAEIGYFHEGDFAYTFSVKEQQGRIFNGTLYVTDSNATTAYPYSGVIEHDMKTLAISEYGTGMDTGYLITPDKMELTLLVNEKNGFAVLCNLEKV